LRQSTVLPATVIRARAALVERTIEQLRGALMQIAAGYVTALVVFVVIDAAWLSVMGHLLYRPTLGDILLPTLRVAPAIVFYAAFPVGILVFAVMPALKADAITTAVPYGLLFGALAYATYDLTNYATLRNWNLPITLLDLTYGAIATAAAAAAATLVARMVAA
jgi:uncharacterized membrane protein